VTLQSAQFRQLTEEERAILDFLLEVPFPGRDEVRRQVADALVKAIDDRGSLEFRVRNDVRAPVTDWIPTQAEMQDIDGIPVRVLLQVVDGVIQELYIYKGDGSKLVNSVTVSKLRLVAPGEDISINDLLLHKNVDTD